MGYAERANPKNTVHGRSLMAALALFPDRETYEQWCAARAISDEQRAHMEAYLPARLQAQGTV